MWVEPGVRNRTGPLPGPAVHPLVAAHHLSMLAHAFLTVARSKRGPKTGPGTRADRPEPARDPQAAVPTDLDIPPRPRPRPRTVPMASTSPELSPTVPLPNSRTGQTTRPVVLGKRTVRPITGCELTTDSLASAVPAPGPHQVRHKNVRHCRFQHRPMQTRIRCCMQTSRRDLHQYILVGCW